jgi:hypothetical protein
MFTPLRRLTTIGLLSFALVFSSQSATADDLARSIRATFDLAAVVFPGDFRSQRQQSPEVLA